MSDRLKMPPVRDFGFYQRRKHDKWREVPAPSPALEAAVADSHAHLHMLPDPAWELARCAANGVDYLCMIVDPSEDGTRPFDELDGWLAEAQRELDGAFETGMPDRACASDKASASDGANAPRPGALPEVRIAAGVHPHNAKLYDDGMEARLRAQLADERIGAVGEIGLDYHYDLSPRDMQRSVFHRQIDLAKEASLPIALHLRGGDDPQADNAHREAFEILQEVGLPERGVLLHCCALPPAELSPWIEAGCHIAYGGALTFKNAETAREGAKLVPVERLMLETDSPYMTPEPMRGAACTPAHVIFTAAALAETRGIAPGEERRAFLQQLYDNTRAFYTLR